MTIKTGLPLPRLELPLVGGGSRAVDRPRDGRFLVLVFYRGSHCRRCNPYLNAFQDLLAQFDACCAEVIAASAAQRLRPEPAAVLGHIEERKAEAAA